MFWILRGFAAQDDVVVAGQCPASFVLLLHMSMVLL